MDAKHKFKVDTSVFEKKPRKPGTEHFIEKVTKDGQRRLVSPEIRPHREPFKNRPEHLPAGWQDTFLDELRMVPVASRAARLAGVSRRTAYKYREIDPEFKEAWEDAEEEGKDKNDEVIVENRDSGREVSAIFLAKVWRYGGADIGRGKNGETKITVGWEDK